MIVAGIIIFGFMCLILGTVLGIVLTVNRDR